MECKVIVIPPLTHFIPAEVADYLERSPSTVQTWMNAGKLTWARNDRGRRIILRTDLVIFIRNYLRYENTADSS